MLDCASAVEFAALDDQRKRLATATVRLMTPSKILTELCSRRSDMEGTSQQGLTQSLCSESFALLSLPIPPRTAISLSIGRAAPTRACDLSADPRKARTS